MNTGWKSRALKNWNNVIVRSKQIVDKLQQMISNVSDYILSSAILKVLHLFVKASSYSCPLDFIRIYSNELSFIALLDSGAQVNLISSDLLTQLHTFDTSGPFSQIQGIGDKSTKIQRWVRVTAHLENGEAFEMNAAVIKSLPKGIILGQPFLQAQKGIIDCNNGILSTTKGPINIHRYDSPTSLVQTVSTVHNVLEASNILPDEKTQL